MPRGFDYLNNTAGYMMIGFAALLVLGIIVVGGIMSKFIARDEALKRDQLRKDHQKK